VKQELVVMGVAWVLATFTAAAAWATHFGYPRAKGSASVAACAVTGVLVVLLGVVFIVMALTEIASKP
jgi:glucan phosphoethanolaminetransferase (alkaline phosphatase superfamily)